MKYFFCFLILTISSKSHSYETDKEICSLSINDSYYRSPPFKNRYIIFTSSKNDLDIKNQMLVVLKPSSKLKIKDLDNFFKWDRKNNMEYIYKILDLVDRTYVVNIESKEYKQHVLQLKSFCGDKLNEL